MTTAISDKKVGRAPKKISKLLLPGDAGVEQTLDDMRRLIRRDVSHPIVRSVLKDHGLTPGKTTLATAEKVFNIVADNVPYVDDPPDEEGNPQEFYVAPILILDGTYPQGDCDDLSGLLNCLLLAAGFDVALKVIAWRPERRKDGDPYTHIYSLCHIPGLGTIPLDPVMQEMRRDGKGYDGFGNERAPVFRSKVFWI